jgi:hypothetical protein
MKIIVTIDPPQKYEEALPIKPQLQENLYTWKVKGLAKAKYPHYRLNEPTTATLKILKEKGGVYIVSTTRIPGLRIKYHLTLVKEEDKWCIGVYYLYSIVNKKNRIVEFCANHFLQIMKHKAPKELFIYRQPTV